MAGFLPIKVDLMISKYKGYFQTVIHFFHYDGTLILITTTIDFRNTKIDKLQSFLWQAKSHDLNVISFSSGQF